MRICDTGDLYWSPCEFKFDRGFLFLSTLTYPRLSWDKLVIVSFFTYQDIFPVIPWFILHVCHVHFHSTVAQLTVYCVLATWSDSEVKTITCAFIFTQIVTFNQKMDVMT